MGTEHNASNVLVMPEPEGTICASMEERNAIHAQFTFWWRQAELNSSEGVF